MRRVIGVLAAVVLSVPLAAPAAAAPAPGPAADRAGTAAAGQLSVLSHNIAGGMTHSGHPNALQPVYHEMLTNGRRADAVALQEVCHQQAAHFSNTMAAHGYVAWWRPIKHHPKCGAHIGDLIAVKSQFYRHWWSHDFFGDPDGVGLACAVIVKVRAVIVCSTHLPSAPENLDQRISATRQMKDIANGHMPAGYGLVMAGDFNSHPTGEAMDRMYSIGGGGGPYNEADQTRTGSPQRSGEWTHAGNNGGHGKLDYVFFSTNMSRPNAGLNLDVLRHPAFSDHALIIGRTEIR